MVRRVRWYFVGSIVLGVLGVLVGCSGGRFFGEREPWRREAEAACINSGAVKEGPGKVRITAIDGPGMCGADYPIKVLSLGEGVPLAFGGELRPPAGIPDAANPNAANPNAAMPPRWPGAAPRQPPYDASPPAYPSSVESRPLDAPMSLDPRALSARGAVEEPYDFRRPYGERGGSVERESAPAHGPSLGPSRGPPVIAAAGPVTVSPAATLACPLVSALDQWVAGAVQPAALRWFGQPVVEIRQISAYSCRGMNGNPNAHISEHAFGNALDIAAFTLADGRKITVKDGWRGAPQEQGFLRDVQGAACDTFSTVLAPGSNAFHYDHIHVDLMRRSGGRSACNPRAVSGEEVAARARARHAGQRGEVTGSATPRRISTLAKQVAPTAYTDERTRRDLPAAVPGDD
jgi:hypothetical protein